MLGSPPHGRGTRQMQMRRRVVARLTPARAGNTPSASRPGRWSWAHPRTGGEHSTHSAGSQPSSGSPPHGRGTPDPSHMRDVDGRLTPARAGNTVTPRRRSSRWRAHPRTGGEHHQRRRPRRNPPGLTPARAGNTTVWRACRADSWAHPRTGGEHTMVPGIASPALGSPPHGRGTQRISLLYRQPAGLTPARAGNTPCAVRRRRRPRAHPRTGGEHARSRRDQLPQPGSPPHGRGTPVADPRPGPRRGLTPARAGEHATFPQASPETTSAHPPHGRGTLGAPCAV